MTLSLLFYVIAVVLFVVAAFLGGVHATAGDLSLFGLAAFAAAHIAPASWAVAPQRG